MIRKAVIPAAGLGTRFLPATKEQPKEMLPIVDTPTIQFVVEEAVSSGIDDIIVISGKGKRAIEDHFDRSFELEYDLSSAGKHQLLQEVKRILNLADIHFIRQKESRGLGDAVYYARTHIAGEPFAVLLGDTIIDSEVCCTRQLIDAYSQYNKSMIAVERVPREKTSRYGVIAGKEIAPSVYRVTGLVEKPGIEEASSDLAIGGRYVLTPEIFPAIEKTRPGVGGEIQLTDALRILIEKEEVYAYCFDGKRYDMGNRLDYLKTIVEFALKRPDLGDDFRNYLEEILS